MPQTSLVSLCNGHGVASEEVILAIQKTNHSTLCVANGNAKLGQIWNFSLPWRATCPGRSRFCEEYCYVRNRNLRPSVIHIHEQNWEASKQPHFAEQMVSILRETQIQWKCGQSRILRLHPSGDFYSEKYIEDWIQIAAELPNWRFFGYTHSWNCDLEPALAKLRDLPNVSLYASIDGTTAFPSPYWRLQAWMSHTEPPNIPRCRQEVALKVKAFQIWKSENQKPTTWQADPGKDALREIAIHYGFSPLYCLDCGHCIMGAGNVWFKMRTKVDLSVWLKKREE